MLQIIDFFFAFFFLVYTFFFMKFMYLPCFLKELIKGRMSNFGLFNQIAPSFIIDVMFPFIFLPTKQTIIEYEVL